jgi:hypothetical protein
MTPENYLELFIPLMTVIVACAWIAVRRLGTTAPARAELTAGENYRTLADEYRRLSDLAITAQEHTDLRLTEISVRLDALHDQLDQMQRILKEVE